VTLTEVPGFFENQNSINNAEEANCGGLEK
jgi:hypothetical protein